MLRQFSDIEPERLATIVKEFFPETTAEILADILYLMFETPENPMLISAYELKISGMDYLTTARKLRRLYPAITAEDMADIMDLW